MSNINLKGVAVAKMPKAKQRKNKKGSKNAPKPVFSQD